MSAKKPKQVRVYLNEEAAELVTKAATAVSDISESQMVSIVVLAGLRALQVHNYRLTLPLRLVVAEEPLPTPIPTAQTLASKRR